MASNLYNQDFTFRNLNITGNLTLANDTNQTEVLTTNMIQDTSHSSSINLNNNGIDLNANVVNILNSLYIDTDAAIQGNNNLRLTTGSGLTLYLNNDKTSGDLHINSSSVNSNTYVDNGNFIVNKNILIQNIILNPIEYLITAGAPNTYYLSEMTVSYNMSFIAQQEYGGQVELYLNSAPPMVSFIVVNQMPNYNLLIINETSNFYGYTQNNNSNNITLGYNKYFTMIAIAGGWYVIYGNI